MKKHLLKSAFIALFATGSAHAAVLYNSGNFSFTAGNLGGQDGWSAHSGAGSIPVQVNTTGTITLNQGSGSREDVNVTVGAIAAGQTYYYGFDVVVSGGDTNAYFAHFKDSASDFTTRLFVTPFAGADFTFGLSAAGSSPDVTWAQGLDFAQSYRIVGSYEADTQVNRIWVNPTTSASTSISFTDPAAAAVVAFALRQGGGNSNQLISNVVVGTTFDSTLAAIPEPSAALFGGLGLLALLRRRRTV